MYGRQLTGGLANRNYVYRSKRGPKPKANAIGPFLLATPIQDLEPTNPEPTNLEPANPELAQVPIANKRGRPLLTEKLKSDRLAAKAAAKAAKEPEKPEKSREGRRRNATSALSDI